MPPALLAPASKLGATPDTIGTWLDPSPQRALDILATGGGPRVSTRADAFSSATAPVARISDANRSVAALAGLGGDPLGSWFSQIIKSPVAAAAANAIPGVGTTVSGALTAYQATLANGAQPQQAAAQVQQQYGLTAEQVRQMIAAAQAQQPQQPAWMKPALIGGGILAGLLVLGMVIRK